MEHRVPPLTELIAARRDGQPLIGAHRGGAAYAPENTLASFAEGLRRGAHMLELDIHLSRDGELVVIHDHDLARTTDGRGHVHRHTLAELKRLDAGAWFDARFRGTRIPTFAETIDALKGRSGLFIELKAPERYPGIEKLILAELEAKGLGRPGADAKTPVLLQSFNAPSLQILAGLGTKLPIHFLVAARDAGPWMTPEGLEKIKAFATGLSPEKVIVGEYRDAMARARKLGFPITPYTFRASAVGRGFADVRAEMAHYLQQLGVDGVITDNPDQMPGR